MDKVIVSPESEVNILVQVLLPFSSILKKISVVTKLQHDEVLRFLKRKKIIIRNEDTDTQISQIYAMAKTKCFLKCL